jgi:nucleotide-binding universal stress UspA family protein
MVMMGTHGRQGLKRMIFGSVAEEVVRRSSVPVLTVHPA